LFRTHAKSWILKGVVIGLFPKWGILRTASGDVFFQAHCLYANNCKNKHGSSLINSLVLGDVMATHCEMADYLTIAELASTSPGIDI